MIKQDISEECTPNCVAVEAYTDFYLACQMLVERVYTRTSVCKYKKDIGKVL